MSDVFVTHSGSGASHFSNSTSRWISTGCGRGLIGSIQDHRWTQYEFGIRSATRWQFSSGHALKKMSRCSGILPLKGQTEGEDETWATCKNMTTASPLQTQSSFYIVIIVACYLPEHRGILLWLLHVPSGWQMADVSSLLDSLYPSLQK